MKTRRSLLAIIAAGIAAPFRPKLVYTINTTAKLSGGRGLAVVSGLRYKATCPATGFSRESESIEDLANMVATDANGRRATVHMERPVFT